MPSERPHGHKDLYQAKRCVKRGNVIVPAINIRGWAYHVSCDFFRLVAPPSGAWLFSRSDQLQLNGNKYAACSDSRKASAIGLRKWLLRIGTEAHQATSRRLRDVGYSCEVLLVFHAYGEHFCSGDMFREITAHQEVETTRRTQLPGHGTVINTAAPPLTCEYPRNRALRGIHSGLRYSVFACSTRNFAGEDVIVGLRTGGSETAKGESH